MEELCSLLDYCKDSGCFKWKRNGKIAGGIDKQSRYYQIIYKKKKYYGHRIAYFIVYGFLPDYIDHINQNKSDNRIENLREISWVGNNRNKSINKNNTSGFIGVSYNKKRKKFESTAMINYKNIRIGMFDTAYDAHIARKEFDAVNGFSDIHGKQKETK